MLVLQRVVSLLLLQLGYTFCMKSCISVPPEGIHPNDIASTLLASTFDLPLSKCPLTTVVPSKDHVASPKNHLLSTMYNKNYKDIKNASSITRKRRFVMANPNIIQLTSNPFLDVSKLIFDSFNT